VGGGGVGVLPDDLAHIVDAKCPGAGSGRGIVERSVKTVGEEEAVLTTIVAVPPDDLAGRVDALCKGLVVGQGIVDDGVGATAKEEAVEAAGVRIERMLERLEATLVPPPRPCLRIITHQGDDEAAAMEKALAEHVACHPEDAGRTVKDFNWIVLEIVQCLSAVKSQRQKSRPSGFGPAVGHGCFD
jgi:hypothetical protein